MRKNLYSVFKPLILTGRFPKAKNEKPAYLFPGTRDNDPRLKATITVDGERHNINVDLPFNGLITYTAILESRFKMGEPFREDMILKGAVFIDSQYTGDEKKGRATVVHTEKETYLEVETKGGYIMEFPFHIRAMELSANLPLIQKTYCLEFFKSWIRHIESTHIPEE